MFERILSIIDNAKYYFISMVGGFIDVITFTLSNIFIRHKIFKYLEQSLSGVGHESTIRILLHLVYY